MSERILQINFRFDMTRMEYERDIASDASQIAAVPGLRWKVWLMNEVEREAGGIYLFDSEPSLQAFLGPVTAQLESLPGLREISAKQFDVLPEATAITRGPVERAPRAKTFNEMLAEALATVPTISPVEASHRMDQDPSTLVIYVGDAADIAATGTIPSAVAISYGALTYQADHEVPAEWRAPQLADHSRPIITTCILGPLGALAGKLLKDMGFTNVFTLEGGVQAWIDVGLPIKPFGGEALAA